MVTDTLQMIANSRDAQNIIVIFQAITIVVGYVVGYLNHRRKN